MVSEAQRILYLEADVESGHDLLAKAIERTQFRDSQLAEANERIAELEAALLDWRRILKSERAEINTILATEVLSNADRISARVRKDLIGQKLDQLAILVPEAQRDALQKGGRDAE